MLHYIKTLARKFHRWGYTLHESVLLASEEIDPYRELKLALNVNQKPSRKFQLDSRL